VAPIPFDRSPQAGLELGGRVEAEFALGARYVEASPRLPIGLPRVPRDSSSKPVRRATKVTRSRILDSLTGAEIRRFGFVVSCRRQNDRSRAVLDEQEVAAGSANASNHCCPVNHDLRPRVSVHARYRVSVAQVVVARTRHEYLGA
jgi:hypothetical protein